MINQEAQLAESLFDSVISERATRDGFGEGLILAGRANTRVVAVCADLADSTRMQQFAQEFPDRFIEVGVSEQHMATFAAGLALGGKIPFIASYATFSPGRNWEQIRTTIAYNNTNVKIAGHHAGLSVGPDGATHQALEDIALMRTLPTMTVISPCDALEARRATRAASQLMGPVYLRFHRAATPVFTTEKTPFKPGVAEIFWQGRKPQVALMATGPVVYEALKAAQFLKKEKIEVLVLNVHTIKPLDERAIVAAARKCGAVIAIEEHQIAGGLGGAIAEVLARKAPTPMGFVGVQDVFGQSGSPQELLREYRLDADAIRTAVYAIIKRVAH